MEKNEFAGARLLDPNRSTKSPRERIGGQSKVGKKTMHIGAKMDGLDSQFKTVKPNWAPHLSFTKKPAKVGTDHTVHPSSNAEEIRVLQTKETHEHDIAIPFFFSFDRGLALQQSKKFWV